MIWNLQRESKSRWKRILREKIQWIPLKNHMTVVVELIINSYLWMRNCALKKRKGNFGKLESKNKKES